MAIILYDLAGADPALRFSPFCWRTRLALAHKGLSVETRPWRFVDKAAIAFSGSEKVPVIVDGGRVVADSWAIAEYLEEAYPDRPSLFGGDVGRAHARFINAWADAALHPAILRLVVRDVWSVLDPGDQDYFRASREARLGATLERIVQDREARLGAVRQALEPLRLVLAASPWLGGEAPSYADHSVFGSLQWPRCVSRPDLLAGDDPVAAWRGRMLGLFDGLAERAAVA
ncbi:MAG: glutathione S-transferase family protein [Acidisphaera sp.]|nr:glutathione S-transferase family protein [Acidisphaera sp.]